jgi:hypothetical protein
MNAVANRHGLLVAGRARGGGREGEQEAGGAGGGQATRTAGMHIVSCSLLLEEKRREHGGSEPRGVGIAFLLTETQVVTQAMARTGGDVSIVSRRHVFDSDELALSWLLVLVLVVWRVATHSTAIYSRAR